LDKPNVVVQIAEARVAELADYSRYPYKGRSGDMGEQQSSSAIPDGKTTPGFGNLTTPGFGPGSAFATLTCDQRWPSNAKSCDAWSEATLATELPLVCDDELLDICDDASSSAGSEASSSQASLPTVRSLTPRSSTPHDPTAGSSRDALVAKAAEESDASSDCSTPRSQDTECMPWQEAPRCSSDASSSSVPVVESMAKNYANTAQSKHGDALDAESDDLQAEVRHLLMQYKIETGFIARSEADGPRQAKEAPGPELSSKSAWIQADLLAAPKA